MKLVKLLGLFIAIGFANASYSQITCDSIAAVANSYLRTENDKIQNRVFISDGQVYRAFLDEDQTAEFEVTFYGNSTYRIATSAGNADEYVIFEIYDQDRNLLFSNYDYANAPYWDFEIDNTIDCTIEVKLDMNKKLSGCVRMMIGFEKTMAQ
ncbi:MAG: hypothetical protein H6599_02180 [Flavobacteriales bacterium]|nr:hypothetical protein [Flavobacteriales bacterium]